MRTKVEICNLALSCLGEKSTVENIDNPTKQSEIVCSKWYDVSRRTALRQLMPSFARKRDIWAVDGDYKPAFGYDFAYKYKNECLKVLGLGNIGDVRNDYAVEDSHILVNENYGEGLPVRYVADIKDLSVFTDDFVQMFAWFLARDICTELTSSSQKYAEIEQILDKKIQQFCSVDAQENKPIRVKNSELLRARGGLYPVFGRKK
jgi:hypothetical protein